MTCTKPVHIIVARYKENLQWLFSILKVHANICATVYNDGDSFTIPNELQSRITVEKGDHIPCEPTKYTSYILSNWDKPHQNPDEVLVFLQGDPVFHNPTLLQVFDYVDQWNTQYQNLTLFPLPPSWNWGCAHEIQNGTAPYITNFAPDARVWNDIEMNDNFEGLYFKDVRWLYELFGHNKLTVSKLCREWGIQKPDHILKTYAAMFATNWYRIQQHPKRVWEMVDEFVKYGNESTKEMNQKSRACIIEYMWSVLLHAHS